MFDDAREKRMTQTFDQARRKAEARDLTSGDDWKRIREIEDQAARARKTAEKQHRKSYSDRVRDEVKKLIDERYSKKLDFKPRDIPSNSDIMRVAEMNVRGRHEQRLQRIDLAEEAEKDRYREEQRREASFERPVSDRVRRTTRD